ncbi:MAG: LruC domain-containing protein [Bacteroidetes bacterium]|nr:LruC domain-containing protein [Bacteroidota bacterium]
MKNIKIIAAIFLTAILITTSNAQNLATITAESGSRAADQANCWGFGAFSPNTTTPITGSYSYYGNAATSLSLGACWLQAPWCKFPNSGNITLKAKCNSTTGTIRRLVFSYYTYDASKAYGQGSLVRFDSVTYGTGYPSAIPTTLQNISIALPSAIINNSNVYGILISAVGTGGTARWILDDVNIPATYWADPSNACKPLALIVDADSDGVQDSDDAYPNDATRAYNNYYPSSSTYGTLMFEDLWPSTGDYDFNDLVLGYRYNRVTNADNKVVEIKATYITKAVGATMHNGFGLQLNGVTSAKVTSVTGAKSNGVNWLTLSGNGTESGQTYANITVFDDALRIMPNQGGSCINTYSENPFVTPDTTNLTISLTTASGQALSISDIVFNPYLIISQTRNKEVHLANFAPTDKASSEYFGTVQDNTTSASSSYKSKVNNLPWALDVPSSIPYMKEKVDFITGYLNFANWAVSNGTSNTDWYLNNTGNRDNSKLY